ncbi:translation initiation factor IF-3, mitochondrial [Osmerus mordax]|uniref:translation initiation factor IF-3, mitochondrial n=1 Tax=Osmerus mordax TaxID=8014 RepID=UPI00350EB47C
MSVGCLRWVLGHAVRVCVGSVNPWRPTSVLLCGSGRCTSALNWRWVQFAPLTTTVDETGEEPLPKKKKQDSRARASISSVGRKIHQRHLQVISEMGENLGTMHRADVLRLMDERGLKLVPLNENKDPPVYRLMSGKQIHEEQLKLREKQKAKGAPVEVKEVLFSSDIAAHDLLTKLNHVRSWLNKKNHVKITLRSGRVQQTQPLDTALEHMVQQIEATVGFVSRPKVIRDGKSAMCILRPPSAKELLEEKNKPTVAQPGVPESQPGGPESQPLKPTMPSPDSPKDSQD